jgi:hypothetical protein
MNLKNEDFDLKNNYLFIVKLFRNNFLFYSGPHQGKFKTKK